LTLTIIFTLTPISNRTDKKEAELDRMDNKKFDKKNSPQNRIETLEKKYGKFIDNEPMEILFNAAREYLMEKGQEKYGS